MIFRLHLYFALTPPATLQRIASQRRLSPRVPAPSPTMRVSIDLLFERLAKSVHASQRPFVEVEGFCVLPDLGVTFLACPPYYGKGLPGRSESQKMVTTHQRLPSFSN